MSKPETTLAHRYQKNMVIRFYDANRTHKDWKIEAKELNIETYDKKNSRPRKKVDVISDIEKQKASN